MITTMSDIELLLQQTSPSNPRLSEAILQEYYGPVYRLAYSILNDPDEAEDAAQITFIRAYQNMGRYQAGTNFRAWLFMITINSARDLLRRQKTRNGLQNIVQSIFHLEDQPESPENMALINERNRALWQAIQKLDDKHRLPILLRYMHGLPVREIATILKTNEGTIHSRLHYAVRKLQTLLNDEPGGVL